MIALWGINTERELSIQYKAEPGGDRTNGNLSVT